jgi:hypothetical protein
MFSTATGPRHCWVVADDHVLLVEQYGLARPVERAIGHHAAVQDHKLVVHCMKQARCQQRLSDMHTAVALPESWDASRSTGKTCSMV